MNRIEELTAQLSAPAGERESIDFAESAPNRFIVMSWFLPEGDSITLTEDLDTENVRVEYCDGEQTIELEEDSPLFNWALNLHAND